MQCAQPRTIRGELRAHRAATWAFIVQVLTAMIFASKLDSPAASQIMRWQVSGGKSARDCSGGKYGICGQNQNTLYVNIHWIPKLTSYAFQYGIAYAQEATNHRLGSCPR